MARITLLLLASCFMLAAGCHAAGSPPLSPAQAAIAAAGVRLTTIAMTPTPPNAATNLQLLADNGDVKTVDPVKPAIAADYYMKEKDRVQQRLYNAFTAYYLKEVIVAKQGGWQNFKGKKDAPASRPLRYIQAYEDRTGLLRLAFWSGYDAKTRSLVVSFRGTVNDQNVQNVLAPSFFTPWPTKACKGDCQVHAGILNGAVTLLPEVIKQIMHVNEKVAGAALKIDFTGHSLGATLAPMVALLIKEQMPTTEVLVTAFSMNRIGNLAWANYYNKVLPKTLRMVNQQDIVSFFTARGYYQSDIYVFKPNPALATKGAIGLLPQVNLTTGYTHIGTEVWQAPGTKQQVQCAGSEDPKCSSSLYKTFLDSAWKAEAKVVGADKVWEAQWGYWRNWAYCTVSFLAQLTNNVAQPIPQCVIDHCTALNLAVSDTGDIPNACLS